MAPYSAASCRTVKPRTGLILSCTVALMAGLLFPAASQPASPMAERARLSLKLDSLELAKQELKRKGESLTELEQMSGEIKDTLEKIRISLEQAAAHPKAALPAAAEQTFSGVIKPFLKVIRPQSPVDWLILVVVGIAIVSALVLVIGLIIASIRKSTRKRKPLPARASGYTRTGMPAAGIGPAESTPAEPLRANDLSELEGLRRRIREDSEQESQDPPALSKGLSAETAPAKVQGDRVPDDIQLQVIAAAKAGMEVSEISRKFHLSMDHVSLIIKVAQKNTDKR